MDQRLATGHRDRTLSDSSSRTLDYSGRLADLSVVDAASVALDVSAAVKVGLACSWILAGLAPLGVDDIAASGVGKTSLALVTYRLGSRRQAYLHARRTLVLQPLN